MTQHSMQVASIVETEKRKKKKKRKYEEVDDDLQGKSKSELKKDRKEKKRRKHDRPSSTSSSLLSTPAESTAPSKDTSHPTYTSSISITSLSFSVEAEAFLRKHSIKIDMPQGVPRATPVIKFSQLNVPAEIQSAFAGFKEPTPIQACTWPPALEGRDVV